MLIEFNVRARAFFEGMFSFPLLHYLPLLYCSIKKAKWLFFSSTFVNKETKLSSILEKEYVDVLIHSQTFQPHINLVLNLDQDVAKTLGHQQRGLRGYPPKTR